MGFQRQIAEIITELYTWLQLSSSFNGLIFSRLHADVTCFVQSLGKVRFCGCVSCWIIFSKCMQSACGAFISLSQMVEFRWGFDIHQGQFNRRVCFFFTKENPQREPVCALMPCMFLFWEHYVRAKHYLIFFILTGHKRHD